MATFLMGTRKLYDFVANNPELEMQSGDYINDPCVIGQHDNMISVNFALQVDLMGKKALDSNALRWNEIVIFRYQSRFAGCEM